MSDNENENVDINQGQGEDEDLASYNPGDSSDEEAFSARPKVNGVIKFSNKADMIFYKAGSKRFFEDYSVDPTELQAFTLALTSRAKDYEWTSPTGTGILDIPESGTVLNQAQPFKTDSLLKVYGKINLDRVREYVKTWIDTESRAVQDDAMLFSAVTRSLSKDGLMRVFHRAEDYTVNGKESGVLAVKTVLDESSLTTNVTVMTLKNELTELKEIIQRMKWNILKFNEKVNMIVLNLTQQGAEAQDLVHQLLPAYLTCPDKQFTAYIQTKKNSFEDGINLTAKSLMNSAKHKYTTLNENREWQAEAETNEQHIALTTKVKVLQKEVKNLLKRGKKSPPKKGKGHFDRKRGQKDGWKMIAPKKGEPNTITVKGKEFHFCSIKNGAGRGCGCNMWTVHKPEQCKGYKKSPPSETNRNSNKKSLQVKEAVSGISNMDLESDTD